MSWITSLAREAVQKGRAYKAPTTTNLARLHANELPWPPDYDPAPGSLNWYPLLYPAALTERMAEHYGVRPEEVSVTRGSSEGIDCLYRGLLRVEAGQCDLLSPIVRDVSLVRTSAGRAGP